MGLIRKFSLNYIMNIKKKKLCVFIEQPPYEGCSSAISSVKSLIDSNIDKLEDSNENFSPSFFPDMINYIIGGQIYRVS